MIVHYIDDLDGIFELVGPGQWNRWLHDLGGHNVLSIVYYLCRLDHLLCVPAIILLYFGLKRLLEQRSVDGLPERQP